MCTCPCFNQYFWFWLIVSHSPFSGEWWGWLLATGAFMACTWASKVNGILTVVAVGVAVLVDLWEILDIKKGNTMVSVVGYQIREYAS